MPRAPLRQRHERGAPPLASATRPPPSSRTSGVLSFALGLLVPALLVAVLAPWLRACCARRARRRQEWRQERPEQGGGGDEDGGEEGGLLLRAAERAGFSRSPRTSREELQHMLLALDHAYGRMHDRDDASPGRVPRREDASASKADPAASPNHYYASRHYVPRLQPEAPPWAPHTVSPRQTDGEDVLTWAVLERQAAAQGAAEAVTASMAARRLCRRLPGPEEGQEAGQETGVGSVDGMSAALGEGPSADGLVAPSAHAEGGGQTHDDSVGSPSAAEVDWSASLETPFLFM